MFIKSKKKLAEAFSKQLDSVQFSTNADLEKLTNDTALQDNKKENLAKLGWAITNLSPGMNKAYNWKGIGKYRFVKMQGQKTAQVTDGLRKSTAKTGVFGKRLETEFEQMDEIMNEMSVGKLHELRIAIFHRLLETFGSADVPLNTLSSSGLNDNSLLSQSRTAIASLEKRYKNYVDEYEKRKAELSDPTSKKNR